MNERRNACVFNPSFQKSLFKGPGSTSRKVLFVLCGTYLVLASGLLVWGHRSKLKTERTLALDRMAGITSTLAAQLDGSRVQRLLNKYDSRGMLITNTQDAYYYVLHESLRKSAEASGVERPLQVIVFEEGKNELEIAVTSASKPALRDAFTGPMAASIIEQLKNGRVEPQRGVFARELASFDAVLDQQGRTVGVVLVAGPIDEVISSAYAMLYRNIAIAVLVFIALGYFVLRSVGRMVRQEEEDRTLWQQRHEGVTDSIAYAGKIQGAMIPKPERYREMFEDHFVLNRPKDMVSGDFHWYHRLGDDQCLVAAADCTGHGLPGAMMAAIGCSLLNELVVQHPHKDPAELLGLLNERIIQALNQNGQRKGAGDGMDVALCRIDRKAHEVLFAGAFRPLYWMHDGQLTIINGDRKPIGGSQHDPKRKFTVHRIAYHPGDRLYLFSDGYVDQFGGPERKKFMAARFNEMIMANHRLPMSAQAAVLERSFLEWKGQNEQVDDVCVLGLAV